MAGRKSGRQNMMSAAYCNTASGVLPAAFEILDVDVNLADFAWDTDVLRTFCYAYSARDASVSLPKFR